MPWNRRSVCRGNRVRFRVEYAATTLRSTSQVSLSGLVRREVAARLPPYGAKNAMLARESYDEMSHAI